MLRTTYWFTNIIRDNRLSNGRFLASPWVRGSFTVSGNARIFESNDPRSMVRPICLQVITRQVAHWYITLSMNIPRRRVSRTEYISRELNILSRYVDGRSSRPKTQCQDRDARVVDNERPCTGVSSTIRLRPGCESVALMQHYDATSFRMISVSDTCVG